MMTTPSSSAIFPRRVGGWPWDFFRESEISVVFGLAKVDRVKNLLEANDIGALRSRAADHRFRFVHIFKRIDRTSHLDQAEFQHGIY